MTLLHELMMREPQKRRGWDAPLGLRLVLAGAAIYLLLVGANLATPLYPLLREQMHLNSAATTLTFTIYVLSLIAGLLGASHWSEHMGRRAVLVAAICAGLLGALIFMNAQDLTALLLGRLFQGAGVALATGASAAAVRDLLPESPDTATRITLLSSSSGVASGPILSGWLSTLGDPVMLPFAVYVLFLVLILVLLLVLKARPATGRIEGQRRVRALMPLRPTAPGEAKRIFWMTSLTGFLSFSIFGFFLSLAPGYYEEILGSSRIMTGLLAALVLGSSAVSQLVNVSLTHRGSAGLMVMAAGLGALLFFGRESGVGLFLSSIFIGLGQGLAFRTLFTHMSASVPRSRHATTISLMYVLTYLGSSFPLILLGLASDAWGQDASVPVFLALTTLIAAGLGVWIRFEQAPPAYVKVSVPEAEIEQWVTDKPPRV